MKKLLLFGGAAAMLAFSACTQDGYTEVTQTIPGSAINIITNIEDGSVIVSQGAYEFHITARDNAFTGYIASPALIANNTSLEFTSDSQSCKYNGVEFYFNDLIATAGSTGMEINNSQITGTGAFVDKDNKRYGYYYDTTEIGDLTYKYYNYMETVARYFIGSKYRVNTFQQNTFFVGTTTTKYTMAGQEHRFSNDGITYRFILDKEKDSDVYTATMVMYNAKFSDSEREPLKVGIIAKGLNVDFTSDGITISGQDIIPDVYEAGSTTPYENFKFNNIVFKTTDEFYTEGYLKFLVAGIYEGEFMGKYVNSIYLK